jgi:anti-repressor protein
VDDLAFQPFDFDGQVVRVVTIDGAPWFIASDAATILEYGRTQEAVRHLDDDERTRCRVDTPSRGAQETTVVSEGGLYHMVLRAKTPNARRFRRWVTDVILPAIARTGSYAVPHLAPAAIAVPLSYSAALRAHADEVDRREAAEARALALAETVAVLEPKAEQADHHRAADGLVSVGDFANSLKAWALREHRARVLHGEVWDFLAELGLLIRGDTNRHNQPTASAVERDFIRVKVGERPSKSCGTKATATPRLTPAGEGWVWDRAVKRIAEHGSLQKPESTALVQVAP